MGNVNYTLLQLSLLVELWSEIEPDYRGGCSSSLLIEKKVVVALHSKYWCRGKRLRWEEMEGYPNSI